MRLLVSSEYTDIQIEKHDNAINGNFSRINLRTDDFGKICMAGISALKAFSVNRILLKGQKSNSKKTKGSVTSIGLARRPSPSITKTISSR